LPLLFKEKSDARTASGEVREQMKLGKKEVVRAGRRDAGIEKNLSGMDFPDRTSFRKKKVCRETPSGQERRKS